MVINAALVIVLLPFPFAAVNFTVNTPVKEYVCAGLRTVDGVVPSPKSHNQLVGLFVDKSLKVTTVVPHPCVISAEKLATGACAFTCENITNENRNMINFLDIVKVFYLICKPT